jgi:hypothetical protein
LKRILREIEKFYGTFGFSAEDLDFLQKTGRRSGIQGHRMRWPVRGGQHRFATAIAAEIAQEWRRQKPMRSSAKTEAAIP